MNDIYIEILSYHPIFDDALLRSMDIMWKDHPRPTIIIDPSIDGYDKLSEMHSVDIRKYNLPFKTPYVELSGSCIFIKPIKIDQTALERKDIRGYSFNPIESIYGVIYKNNVDINVHNVILNDKFSLIEHNIDPDEVDISDFLKWCDKYWKQGKRLNILPFLYSDADDYYITTDLEFKWL